MPVINTYDKPAGEITKGNYVFGEKVIDVQRKRVNTILILDKPVDKKDTWVFKLTDMLEVGVSELTEEEQADKEAEHQRNREEAFVESVKGWATQAVAAVARFEETWQKRIDGGWGLLDYSTIQEQLQVAAHHDLAKQILALFESAKDGTFHYHPELGECEYTERTDTGSRCVKQSSYTELDVAKQATLRQVHQLTVGAMQGRTLSRSTSVIANLCEDMQQQARADFLNAMRYASYGVIEIPGR